MGAALSILWITLVAVLGWAGVVAVRHLSDDLARAVRRPRFGLVDLILLITVICCSLAATRWYWDSIYVGIVLLLIPMVLPLAWLVKFVLEDARLARERRRERRQIVVESFDVPPADELSPHEPRRRLVPPPKRTKVWMPPLSPFSLAERLLQKDDE